MAILSAFAAPQPGAGREGDKGSAGMDRPAIVRADSLRDAKIIDTQGQELGTVKDVELDLGGGSIAYVIMEPGTKDRLIPIPFSAFLLTPRRQLVLDTDPGRLLAAPSYNPEGRAEWSDLDWRNRISAFWSSGPTWQPAGGRTQPEPLR